MSEIQLNRKLIFKNTLFLYLRMLLSMGVSLFSSSIVLNQLGESDYGVYSLVGGFVAIFTFLNSSMSGATSRFLTIENAGVSKRRRMYAFNSALIIHIAIALIVLLLAETIGLWFVEHKLNILPERRIAAMWVYQLSVFAALVSITQVPYNAAIISHEKMDIYAKVEVFNSLAKLGIAFLLFVAFFDSLIFYAVCVFLVSLMTALIYRIYCTRKFSECRFKWKWFPSLGKSMLSFSGLNLYCSFCFAGRQQGTNVLLNIFGGTKINATAGLASTILSMINQIAINLVTASKPQIIAQYVEKNFKQMFRLMAETNLLANTLYLLVAIPFLLELEYTLILWLKILPPLIIPFVMLCVVNGFFEMNDNIVLIGIQAIGKIKFYSILLGTLSLSLVPIFWIILSLNGSFTFAIILPLLCKPISYSICCVSIRKNIPEFSPWKYLSNVLGRAIVMAILPLLVGLIIKHLLDPSFLRLILLTLSTTIALFASAMGFGFPKDLRNKIKHVIVSKIKLLHQI